MTPEQQFKEWAAEEAVCESRDTANLLDALECIAGLDSMGSGQWGRRWPEWAEDLNANGIEGLPERIARAAIAKVTKVGR